MPVFLAYAIPGIDVNRDFVSESELRSGRDLLDPRWKGKMVLQDPRGGAGAGTLTVMLAVYGEDYLRDLLTKQDMVVTGDTRQQAEWAARGRYPIALGIVSHVLSLLQSEGVGRNVKPVKEGPKHFSTGVGSVQLINRPPNPNARKVLANWLMSRQAQLEITQIVETNSLRRDVPPVDPEQVIDISKIEDYIPTPPST